MIWQGETRVGGRKGGDITCVQLMHLTIDHYFIKEDNVFLATPQSISIDSNETLFTAPFNLQLELPQPQPMASRSASVFPHPTSRYSYTCLSVSHFPFPFRASSSPVPPRARGSLRNAGMIGP